MRQIKLPIQVHMDAPVHELPFNLRAMVNVKCILCAYIIKYTSIMNNDRQNFIQFITMAVKPSGLNYRRGRIISHSLQNNGNIGI